MVAFCSTSRTERFSCFTSRLTMDFARPGLPAIALTTDSSFLTAWSNDYTFETVRRPWVFKGRADMVVSTSSARPQRP